MVMVNKASIIHIVFVKAKLNLQARMHIQLMDKGIDRSNKSLIRKSTLYQMMNAKG